MIEAMKKLDLLIYHQSKDKVLTELQNYGVLHLEINKAAQTDEVFAVKETLDRIIKAKRALHYYVEKEHLQIVHKDYPGDIKELLSEIEKEKELLDVHEANLEVLHKELRILSPWGDFKTDNIMRLKEVGLNFKFYTASAAHFAKIDKSEIRYEIISYIKGHYQFVVIYRDGEEEPMLNVVEEHLPKKSLSDLKAEIFDLEKEIEKQHDILYKYREYEKQLKVLVTEYEDKLSYTLADATLDPQADGKVLHVEGWVPLAQQIELEEFLQDKDLAYVIGKPNLEEHDVPVKLKNGPFSKLFEPVTKIFSLPAYTELDTTPFFAPFFALFFGLCLADMGYGLVMLAGVIIALMLVKNKDFKPLLGLGFVLGLTTMIGGFLLDTFFGMKITDMNIVPENVKSWIIFPGANGNTPTMIFAIMLGIVQVIFGQILKMYNRVKSNGWLWCLEGIGTSLILLGAFLVIFIWRGGTPEVTAGTIFPIGKLVYMVSPSPTLVGWIMVGVGTFIILFFDNLNTKLYIRPLAGLYSMYNIITGLLGDILSYIRIFALGLAGGLLGAAFNDISMMLQPVAYVGPVLMVLVFVFGHTLNFGLAALGSFVHPLRLTFVEFYKNVDFEGGGKPFTPFINRNFQNNK